MWYREGTITFTQGSNTLVGVGTAWSVSANGVLPGMIVIGPDNKLYEIKRVASDTNIVLSEPYTGETQSEVPCRIITTYEGDLTQFSARFTALMSRMSTDSKSMRSWLTALDKVIIEREDGTEVTVKPLMQIVNEHNENVEWYKNNTDVIDAAGDKAREAAASAVAAAVSATTAEEKASQASQSAADAASSQSASAASASAAEASETNAQASKEASAHNKDAAESAAARSEAAAKRAEDIASAVGLKDASTTQKGLVQLSSATDSDSETMAATPKAVKSVKDLADAKAPTESPNLTGMPTAPTAAQGTNSTQIANTAFVKAAIAVLTNGAPGTLDTLKGIATAINNDPNFSTTINNALALKAPLASPALTGAPTAPTAAQSVNNTQIATTAFVKSAVAAMVGSAPEALDTLNELAAALGNDPNFSATVTRLIGEKVAKDGDTMTGKLNLPQTSAFGINTDNRLGGNSLTLGDYDTGIKQEGDGVLSVFANGQRVFLFTESSITSLKELLIGDARYSTGGDVYGSQWGNGWLSAWLNARIAECASASHNHSWGQITDVPAASTNQSGIVQLSSDTNSTSESLAATSKAVKAVFDGAYKKPTEALDVDLNTLGSLSDQGVYYQPVDRGATAEKHYPVAGRAGTLVVYPGVWGGCQQEFTCWNPPRRFIRTLTNYFNGSGPWSSWYEVAFVTGNVATATKLQTARNVGGVLFDGSANIDLPGVNRQGNQNTTGNAATATRLQTARSVGGVLFDGSANIDLPGVNATGSQDTTGNAATATKLQVARKINGVAFDGSADINIAVQAIGNRLMFCCGSVQDIERKSGVIYTNTLVYPIFLFCIGALAEAEYASIYVNDIEVATIKNVAYGSNNHMALLPQKLSVSAVIPPGATYHVESNQPRGEGIYSWAELR
ncbi:tail fiber protein [Escherichia coli]|nr:tail fiber protein [Escherichia coli]MCN4693521.1 tail fiber protein [Escherichia coli]MCN7826919.1 tail fiber protein [Escherichia coli]